LLLIITGVVIAVIAPLMFRKRGKSPPKYDNYYDPDDLNESIEANEADEESARLLRRGLNCIMNNDMEGAIDNLNQSLDIDANNGQCHEYLSFTYAQTGHYYLAKKHAEIALNFNSEYFAHIANAMFYRYKLEFGKSLEESVMAINVDGTISHGHFWAGMAYADMGKLRAALVESDIVRKYDTDSATILDKYIRDMDAVVSGKVSHDTPVASRWGEAVKIDAIMDNDTNSTGYYSVLDLNPSASPIEVEEAYLDLVKVWHPDRFTDDPKLKALAEQKLRKINEAYSNLTSL